MSEENIIQEEVVKLEDNLFIQHVPVTTITNTIEKETNHLIIDDTKNIEIYGTEEQKIALLTAWSHYYEEVTNPENTTKNSMLGGAKYAPLNEVLNTVRPILGKHGLAAIQTPYMVDDKVKVKTILTHKDGAIMSFPSSEAKLTKLNNAVTEIQSFGLYATYLRRFSLNAIAGVAGEVDNDGNSVSGKEDTPDIPKKPAKSSQPPQSPLKTEMIELCKTKAKINRDEVLQIVSKYGEKDGKALSVNDEKEINSIIKELNNIKGE